MPVMAIEHTPPPHNVKEETAEAGRVVVKIRF